MADESTNKGNGKCILMYAQYISGDSIDSFLLSNIKVSEGTADADTLVSKNLNELKCKELDLANLVKIGTDGVSVMTGKKWCSEETKRHLSLASWVHCTAHCCALSASQAPKGLPELASFSRNVTNVFKYFDNLSAKKK